MENTLSIITFDKEKWLFETCIRSIAKFVEPCHIIIVYCDPSNEFHKWGQWFSQFSSLLSEFHVRTYNALDWLPPAKNFYFLAQLSRFVSAHRVTTDDYWTIDSKTIFYKPCDVSDMKEEFISYTCRDIRIECYNAMLKINPDITLDFKVRKNSNPHKFNTKYVNRLINENKIIDLFLNSDGGDTLISHPFTYQAYCALHGLVLDEGECDQNNSNMFLTHKESHHIKTIIPTMKNPNPNIYSTAMHFDVVKLYSKTENQYIISRVAGSDVIPKYASWIY